MTTHGLWHVTSHVAPRSAHSTFTSTNFDIVNVIITLLLEKKHRENITMRTIDKSGVAALINYYR